MPELPHRVPHSVGLNRPARRLPVPLVVDHMGRIDPAQGARAEAFGVLRALVQAAPERLVWGSDWPHTTETPDTVNDADLVDLLLQWCGLEPAMDRILVDNPARLYGFAPA